jgi:hypothetical protein
MKKTAVRDLVPRSLVEVDRRFKALSASINRVSDSSP